jgi:radical SAM protein with 4Fe4S-binding SPASM domain
MKNGLYCSGGHDYFAITSNGDVAPCNAFARQPEHVLGNLFADEVFVRRAEAFSSCPIQACNLPCDRQHARKQVWKNDQLVDTQEMVYPKALKGKARPVTFIWAPTWKCNYDCAYCSLPPAKDERPAAEWVAAFHRFFDANNIDGGLVAVTGGEPLFYKEIGSVLHALSARGFVLQLTTNLSGDVQRALIQAVPPEKFVLVSCSLHPSVKHFHWEQFRGRVLSLKAYGYNVAVNFVGHPDQIMLAPDYHAFFKAHDVPFVLIPMEGEFNGVRFETVADYPPAMQRVIHKISPEWVKDGNRFADGKRRSLPMASTGAAVLGYLSKLLKGAPK